jgi:hypothetical protein
MSMAEAVDDVPQHSDSRAQDEWGSWGESVRSSVIPPTVDAGADDSIQNEGIDLSASGQLFEFWEF